MAANSAYVGGVYEAMVVVSAAEAGVEKKDQDRAVWFAPGLTACVCDGVTSSPYAAEAAETVTRFSPALFGGDIKERLKAVSDLLLAHRLDAMAKPVMVGSDVPSAMVGILTDVAREKMRQGFQTTMVAANFVVADDMVVVTVVRCGDSAFLAFSPDGELLLASMEGMGSLGEGTDAGEAKASPAPGSIRFGPGDSVLAKVVSDAAQQPLLAEMAGVPKDKTDRWLICACLDLYAGGAADRQPLSGTGRTLWLKVGDLLVVPKYLAEVPADPGFNHYVRLRYSRSVRPAAASRPAGEPVFGRRGWSTPVLPDHFYTNQWVELQERLPLDAQFILATDGFHGCFQSPAEMLAWLKENEEALRRESGLEPVRRLHARLAEARGDDDISFIWVRPCRAEPTGGAAAPEPLREGGDAHARR